MSDFYCTRCLAPQERIFALLDGESVEVPPLGMIHNPLLTECCKEGWDPMPPRGKPAFRIAIDFLGRPGFVSFGIARYTQSGTPYCRWYEQARLWPSREGAERWIREHPLERLLKPRIEEVSVYGPKETDRPSGASNREGESNG